MESSCDISLSGTCAEDKFISGVYEDVRHVQLRLIIARVMHCGGGTQPSEYCNMINTGGWQRGGWTAAWQVPSRRGFRAIL